MQVNEKELLARAKNRDRMALSDLLELVGPIARKGVEGSIPARWQSVLSADDVMQQTYTDAFLGITGFASDEPATFSAWLCTLARRNLVDALRMLGADKRGGQFHAAVRRSQEDSISALYDAIGQGGSTPSRVVAREESAHKLEDAVQGLPEVYRRVVSLYDLEGMAADEVAAMMNRSVGAMYMLRARAHDRLRDLLGSSMKYFSDPA